MAQAYALFFAAKECTTINNNLISKQALDDLSSLPLMHAVTAALKVYSTQVAFDGAEEARKCCGGYGYSVLTGFSSILMKAITNIKEGVPVDDGLSYLVADTMPFDSSIVSTARCRASETGFFIPETQIKIFRHHATRLTFHSHQLFTAAQSDTGDNLTYAEAWNRHMRPLVHAARAHIELFIITSFIEHTTTTACPDPAIHGVLDKLRSLFALTAIENPLSQGSQHFVEDAYISHSQLEHTRGLVNELLGQLTLDVIAL